MSQYTTTWRYADAVLGGSDSYPVDKHGNYLPKRIPFDASGRLREDLAYFKDGDTIVVRADRVAFPAGNACRADDRDPLEIRVPSIYGGADPTFDASATLWAGQPHRLFKGYAIRWYECSYPIPPDARSGGEPFIECVRHDAFTEHLDQPVIAATKHRDPGTVFACSTNTRTMQVGADNVGIWIKMAVPNAVAEAHMVYGRFLRLSPRFSVLQESHSRLGGVLHRRVEEGILREVAIVSAGAYSGSLAEAY